MASTGTIRNLKVALLTLGSAILLFSCEGHDAAPDTAGDAALMTEYSERLSIVMSQNGSRSYFFETPLLEGYTLAAEPYREFRRGIRITTYRDDSLTTVDAVLTANYAIYYEQRKLWETRGDVEVRKYDGTELYTQQLFWDARTKRIYSNVDTKLVKGNNVSIGERFESDEDFKDWRFRYQKSRMEVEVAPSERDTTAVDDMVRFSEPVPLERKTAVPPSPAAARDLQQPAPSRDRQERKPSSAEVRPERRMEMMLPEQERPRPAAEERRTAPAARIEKR